MPPSDREELSNGQQIAPHVVDVDRYVNRDSSACGADADEIGILLRTELALLAFVFAGCISTGFGRTAPRGWFVASFVVTGAIGGLAGVGLFWPELSITPGLAVATVFAGAGVVVLGVGLLYTALQAHHRKGDASRA